MSKIKKLDKRYFWIYSIGLGLTFGFAFVKYLAIEFLDNSLNYNYISEALLVIPIIFIVGMFIYSLRRIKKQKSDITALRVYYKEYIQLEGYIQTLIGFFIAILGLIPVGGNNDIDFSLVALPIGMALTTSILGWYFGSYLSPPQTDPLNESLDLLKKTTTALSNNIRDLGGEILLTKNKYEETRVSHNISINNLIAKQNEMTDEYMNSLVKLKETNSEYSSDVSNSLNNIKNDLNNYKYTFHNSLKDLNNDVKKQHTENLTTLNEANATYFATFKNNIQEGVEDVSQLNNSFKKYIDEITQAFGVSSIEMSSFITNVKNYNETLIENSEKSNNSFQNIEDGITNIKSTILDDLYENHSLRKDLGEINKSIRKIKPITLFSWLKPKNK